MTEPDRDLRIRPIAAPVREQLVSSLRYALFSQRFLPGQRLPERELCELTGASRTALREALRQLEAEGLIKIVPHRGPSVTQIDARTADEIYQVREPLESLLAGLAAENAGDVQIRQLTDVAVQLKAAFVSGSASEIVAAKTEFYDLLFGLAGNTELETVLRRLIGRMGLIWPAMMVESGEAAASFSEISLVIDAIAAKNAAAARNAMAAHIASARRLTRNYLMRASAQDA
ncbi:GntR family transcriptional regulator [Seohaeicola saemankumensis]|nr:GntR family transcriptional regulator [Seohaeicola saemankumensis]MCA0870379.1 GntR family transcriptional regulator [Seohaeicola saemankumensis]